MVIAVDGPGGVGKSTVGRAVAARLGMTYLATGSLYRACTLAVLRAGVAVDDIDAVVAVVGRTGLDFGETGVLLDGEEVGEEIRSEWVTAAVSPISMLAAVRDHVTAATRAWVKGRDGAAVVEGRDIGTVVFPGADVKVFLDARPEVRAARRASDAEAADKTVATVAAELRDRDHLDSTRVLSPLRPADDAVVIDTSDMSIGDVIETVIALAGSGR